MSELELPSRIDDRYFDAMFRYDDDPWQFRTRWYEQRKRALTLACLPAARYASAYEPGCANGELSASLAARCDRLLVSDGSDRALEIARERLRAHAHVRVAKGRLPQDWPEESFDLIVFSELGYYFDAEALRSIARRMLASLAPTGTVLACHWRHPIDGCAMVGDAVHAVLDEVLALPHWSGVIEPDLRIDVWSREAGSVGEREGLVNKRLTAQGEKS